MAHAVIVDIWQATHTSGTKFYHVVRFTSANGHSIALHHYGPTAVFTGMGKVATGQVDVGDSFIGDSSAGKKKIREKKRGGYTQDEQNAQHDFPSVANAVNWMRANFGAKAQGMVRNVLTSEGWAVKATPRPAVGMPAPADGHLTSMSDHKDWGMF